MPSAELRRQRKTGATHLRTHRGWDELSSGAGYRGLPVDESLVEAHEVPDLGSLRFLRDPSLAARPRVNGGHERVRVPSFHIGGWHDIFLQGTLDNYGAMAALGIDARLVVGPWTHMDFRDPIGQECFGFPLESARCPSAWPAGT